MNVYFKGWKFLLARMVGRACCALQDGKWILLAYAEHRWLFVCFLNPFSSEKVENLGLIILMIQKNVDWSSFFFKGSSISSLYKFYKPQYWGHCVKQALSDRCVFAVFLPSLSGDTAQSQAVISAGRGAAVLTQASTRFSSQRRKPCRKCLMF